MSDEESEELAEAVVKNIIETAIKQTEEEMLLNGHGRTRKHVHSNG